MESFQLAQWVSSAVRNNEDDVGRYHRWVCVKRGKRRSGKVGKTKVSFYARRLTELKD